MNIAERFERLKQFNRKNNSAEDDSPLPTPTPNFARLPYYPPSSSEDDSDIKGDLNPTQKFLLGDRPQIEKIAVAVGEKIAVGIGEKQVKFSENLSKVFPEASDIFDSKKTDIDDLPEITIRNTQTMFTELNDGKLPEELIAGVTDDRFDIDTHSTSKFSFDHFNNLRRSLHAK